MCSQTNKNQKKTKPTNQNNPTRTKPNTPQTNQPHIQQVLSEDTHTVQV